VVSIRTIIENDIPNVLSLMGQYRLQYPNFVRDLYPTRWSDFLSYNGFDNSEYIVAINEDSEVLGHAGFLYNSELKMPEIVGVVVSRNYSKQGIGKELIKTLCSHLQEKGQDKVILFTLGHPENKGTIQFYKSINTAERTPSSSTKGAKGVVNRRHP